MYFKPRKTSGMQKTILLFPLTLLISFAVKAQNSQHIFAITGQAKSSFYWADIRTFDSNTGNLANMIYESGVTPFAFRDAVTNTKIEKWVLNGKPSSLEKNNTRITADKIEILDPLPTALKSAAMAYDARHGKLFFASMHTGSLMWLNLKDKSETPVFYTIDQPLVRNEDYTNEALNITRMAMGADGKGYAITNDGSSVISFTTGKKTVLTNLGGLKDATSNNSLSIQNKCTSWGGDIVGDVSGKLILFSATQNVFEINLSSMVATYLGRVQNLPTTYSLNGAAVDENDDVIVSSANTLEGFYKINMKDLLATKLVSTSPFFTASDLASSHLLGHSKRIMGSAILTSPDIIGNQFITIYPNPVNNGQIKIGFEKMKAGQYKVAFTDLQGRLIENKTVIIKFSGQVENFKFQTNPVKGMYLIKVTNSRKEAIYSDKILVN